jgi:hypothetical protein
MSLANSMEVTMLTRFALVGLLVMVACGGGGPGGGQDLAPEQDLATAGDMAMSPPDLNPGSALCHNAGCRKFSSYCSTDPCKCIALVADNPDPTCTGTMVTCTVDPCDGEVAACNQGNGKCVLQ